MVAKVFVVRREVLAHGCELVDDMRLVVDLLEPALELLELEVRLLAVLLEQRGFVGGLPRKLPVLIHYFLLIHLFIFYFLIF
jgi:hypothetical protein